MASIPGPILLIVGIGVGVFSYIFSGKTFELVGAYSIFLYLGGAIALYGFAKTLIWLMTRKSGEEVKEEVEEGASNSQGQQQMSAFEGAQRIDFDKERQAMTSRCQSCGYLYYSHANFCQSCGTRLR